MSKWAEFTIQGDCAPSERHGHTAVPNGSKLYLFGGTPDGSSGLADVYVLDTITGTWSAPEVIGTRPAGRYRHTAAIVNNKMYIFGGYRSKCLGDLHVLDLDTMVWTQPPATGMWPSARSSHTAITSGDSMVIFGGSGHKYSNELFILDTTTMVWRKEETKGDAPSERWCHTAVLFGKKMFIFGGSNDRRRHAEVYVLDLSTMTWSKPAMDGPCPQARHLHTACGIGQCMVVFGGWVPYTELNDLYVLNTRTMTWTKHQSEVMPPARQLHTACTIDGKMVVFGGYSKNKRMNDIHTFALANSMASLQELCVDTLVNYLPQTMPHLNVLTEELLLSLFRKIGQAGKMSSSDLASFLDGATYISELSLMTCSESVDDCWMDALSQQKSSNVGNILKLDLSNCKKISDEGIKKLASLPNLRVVIVDGESGVTPDGASWLKQNLPSVNVIRMVSVGNDPMYLEFEPTNRATTTPTLPTKISTC